MSGGQRTGLRVPVAMTAAERADVQADLARLVEWQSRNEHRNDDQYRLVQKPANDRGIHRALRNLKEGK